MFGKPKKPSTKEILQNAVTEMSLCHQDNAEIERAKLREQRRHNESEERTKDRVDLSLADYQTLLKEKAELEEKVEGLERTFNKLLQPMYMAKVPEEVMKDILGGKFEARLLINENPFLQKTNLALVFEVDNLEYPKYA